MEFTSDRKRMSTIVRDGKGDIWLYTKGAESHVFPLCLTETHAQSELMKSTQTHIDDFAKIGLRTLAVARRKLTEEEYQTFDVGKWKRKIKTSYSFENNDIFFLFQKILRMRVERLPTERL